MQQNPTGGLRQSLFAGIGAALLLAAPGAYAAEIETRIGTLTFTQDFASGYPTDETVEMLYDERDFQRATQLYLWALPMVSLGEVENVFLEPEGAKYGDLMRMETKEEISRFLTGNATTPYAMTWIDLSESGPYVLEIPAGPTAGFVNDLWQRTVTDIGLPGPDRGMGGKYLLLGPGQDAPAGTDDYIIKRSLTYNALFLFRLLSASGNEAEELLAQFRMYPYSQRDNPPEIKQIRPVPGGTSLGNAPRGLRYFERLAHWINEEPAEERDRIMLAMARSIGIEKGKPFAPDDRMTELLIEAALVGEAMAKANDFDKRNMELSHYSDNVQWHFSLALDISQETPNYTQLDERAAWFYEATATSVGMATQTPGVGSVYLGAYKDSEGNWLDGANNYRLNVPANAPAEQFWSLTLYDVSTRALIDNGTDTVDRSSRQNLIVNADGSVDIYIGPDAPAGFERNWIPTVAGKAWFPYFRLYAPTKAHFDRAWILPDFERLN